MIATTSTTQNVTLAKELATAYAALSRVLHTNVLLPGEVFGMALEARQAVSAAWNTHYESLTSETPDRFDALGAWIDTRTAYLAS